MSQPTDTTIAEIDEAAKAEQEREFRTRDAFDQAYADAKAGESIREGLDDLTVTIRVPQLVKFSTKCNQHFVVNLVGVPKEKLESFLAECAVQGIRKGGVDAGASAKEWGSKQTPVMDTRTARGTLIGKKVTVFNGGDWATGGHSVASIFAGLSQVLVDAVLMQRSAVKAQKGSAWYKDADEPTRKAAMLVYWGKLPEEHKLSFLSSAQAIIDANKAAKEAEQAAAQALKAMVTLGADDADADADADDADADAPDA